MAAIPIRELSHHTARTLDVVKAGETVEIAERGTVIGRIVPVDPSRDIRVRVIAEGRMRSASLGRADLIAGLRRGWNRQAPTMRAVSARRCKNCATASGFDRVGRVDQRLGDAATATGLIWVVPR